MPDPSARAFAPALFRFLRDLRKNNDRDWYLAHKEGYESDVKGPALAFISAFAAALRKISPHLVADPRPVGGSLFRIHRDVRFGADKRPYKTHVGIHFRHAGGEGAHAPGFYLQLEPGDVFAGAGIWQPDGAVLSEVRDAIAESPAAWRSAAGAPHFPPPWALSGESPARLPDADHFGPDRRPARRARARRRRAAVRSGALRARRRARREQHDQRLLRPRGRRRQPRLRARAVRAAPGALGPDLEEGAPARD